MPNRPLARIERAEVATKSVANIGRSLERRPRLAQESQLLRLRMHQHGASRYMFVFGKHIGQRYGLDLSGPIRRKSAFGFGGPEGV